MEIPDSLFQEFNAKSDEELISILGKSANAEESYDDDDTEHLMFEDARHIFASGQRWFAEYKDRFRRQICASAQLKDLATSSRASQRLGIYGFIAGLLCNQAHITIHKEGAIAFAILVTREGLAIYCEKEWNS